MRAVEAVAIRAGVQRPRVEVVDDDRRRPRPVCRSPAQRADLAAHGFDAFLRSPLRRTPSVAGQDVPGRIVVVATGDTQKEIDEAIDGILPVRPAEERADNPSAARALANQFGYPRARRAARAAAATSASRPRSSAAGCFAPPSTSRCPATSTPPTTTS